MDTQTWLKNWLQARGRGEPGALGSNDDFVALGVLDSFGTVELISATEEHYGIEFEPGDFQDKAFTTIAGFCGAIDRRCKQKGDRP
ncbi:MAG: acyl carrier protein [Kiritimatiellae bacterium]|nr:acyl carrier protein [Kiritimatiellia bacterium]